MCWSYSHFASASSAGQPCRLCRARRHAQDVAVVASCTARSHPGRHAVIMLAAAWCFGGTPKDQLHAVVHHAAGRCS